MSTISPGTRYEFIKDLYLHTHLRLVECERIGRQLMRVGATYKRLQEAFCDADLGDAEEAWRARETRLEAHVKALCEELGVKAVFSGDPRGATIKLVMPDGYTTDWGRTGVCVPTS